MADLGKGTGGGYMCVIKQHNSAMGHQLLTKKLHFLSAGCPIKTFAYIDMLQTESDFRRCKYCYEHVLYTCLHIHEV